MLNQILVCISQEYCGVGFDRQSTVTEKVVMSRPHSLGRGCGISGRFLVFAHRVEKSRAAYDELFRIWKDADPDLPPLMEAKAEYAKLFPK
jgi:hypothetical protein